MKLPEGFAFSQSSLQEYADCPRRFQLRYVLGVQWPMAHETFPLAWERSARLGAAFHRLVQQHLLCIEPGKLASAAKEAGVAAWWHAYLSDPPRDLPPVRRAELSLSAPLASHRLAARYDLVATEPGSRAVIVDWKTTESRPQRVQLAARLQTQVYLYVLVEASAEVNEGQPLAPAQVELLYWFANHPQQSERFTYDRAAHTVAGRRLGSLGAEIATVDMAEWALTPRTEHCRNCPYRTLCDREGGPTPGEAVVPETEVEAVDFDLEQIAEIEF
jgi:CRISPR/Cas system-associated exonuclease Cas4 (RecB family)